ncbi:DUF7919 family protein [Streptomyces sp. NPDC054841]
MRSGAPTPLGGLVDSGRDVLRDLTPYTYFTVGPQGGASLWRRVPLVNMGWLHRGRPYAKRAAPAGLAEALKRMTRTHRAQQTRGGPKLSIP